MSEESDTTYYDILNINKNATDKDISIAWRKMAKKYHPDMHNNLDTNEMFIKCKEAYDILSDNVTRAKYDQYIESDKNYIENDSTDSDDNNTYVDNTIYDIKVNISSSLEDFYNGKTSEIEFIRYNICECIKNKSDKNDCLLCCNSGKIPENQTIMVSLPRGELFDYTICMENIGTEYIYNSNIIRSNVYISFSQNNEHYLFKQFDPHSNLAYNLEYNREISIIDMLCGFTYSIPHLNGNIYNFYEPDIIDLQNPIRYVNGLGLYNKNLNTYGDLIIKYIITSPKNLTLSQKKIIYESFNNTKYIDIYDRIYGLDNVMPTNSVDNYKFDDSNESSDCDDHNNMSCVHQ